MHASFLFGLLILTALHAETTEFRVEVEVFYWISLEAPKQSADPLSIPANAKPAASFSTNVTLGKEFDSDVVIGDQKLSVTGVLEPSRADKVHTTIDVWLYRKNAAEPVGTTFVVGTTFTAALRQWEIIGGEAGKTTRADVVYYERRVIRVRVQQKHREKQTTSTRSAPARRLQGQHPADAKRRQGI